MNEPTRKEGLWRNFCISLQTLALDSDAQVRAIGPGCVTCELTGDFIGNFRIYKEEFGADLSREQLETAQAILDYFEDMPEEDLECFNSEVLKQESWEQLRILARKALPAFGLSLDDVPAYREVQPGIWRRP